MAAGSGILCQVNWDEAETPARGAKGEEETKTPGRHGCILSDVPIVGKHLMWQKERLLNVGISLLPQKCSKVAWVDCDLLFENRDWLEECSARLDSCSVLQPYSVAIRLLRGHTTLSGSEQQWRSFSSVFSDPAGGTRDGWHAHGHTGFAWAGRREWLASAGLYDACIGGSADHMMAHAFASESSVGCVSRLLGSQTAQERHFLDWARRLQASHPQRIGAMDGRLFHLWHGEIENRGYMKRHLQLASLGFDPASDIKIGSDGCWEWANRAPEMMKWAETYFSDRREDG